MPFFFLPSNPLPKHTLSERYSEATEIVEGANAATHKLFLPIPPLEVLIGEKPNAPGKRTGFVAPRIRGVAGLLGSKSAQNGAG